MSEKTTFSFYLILLAINVKTNFPSFFFLGLKGKPNKNDNIATRTQPLTCRLSKRCGSYEAIFLHLLIEMLMFYSRLIRISAFSDKSNQTAALDIPLTPHLQTQWAKKTKKNTFLWPRLALRKRVYGHKADLGFLACVFEIVWHVSMCWKYLLFLQKKKKASKKTGQFEMCQNIAAFCWFFNHRLLMRFSYCILYVFFYLVIFAWCSV